MIDKSREQIARSLKKRFGTLYALLFLDELNCSSSELKPAG
jgi:hypothetical protein